MTEDKENVYCPTNSRDESQHLGEGTHGSNIRFVVRGEDRLALILASFALAVAICSMTWSSFLRSHQEELRIRLEDAQAQLLTAQCVKPGDAIHGPLANPDRLKEK